MTSVLALLPALLSAAAPQGPQQSDDQHNVLEIIPLHHLCDDPPSWAPPFWSSMLLGHLSSEPSLRQRDLLQVSGDDKDGLKPTDIAMFLSSLNEEATDEGLLHFLPNDRGLFVMGSNEAVTTVREHTRTLTSILASPLEIEVAFWRAGDGTAPATVLSADDYGNFADSHELLWRQRATTCSNRPVKLEDMHVTNYVQGVEVEVAQDSMASHPVTHKLFEGAEVVVSPHRLVSRDGFALQVQFTWSERLRPMERLATGIPDTAQLDIPTIASLCGACSATIDNGETLCVTMRGDSTTGTSCIMTARVTEPDSAVPPGQLGLDIFPISALTNPGLLDRLSTVSLHWDQHHEHGIDQPEPGGYGHIELSHLEEVLHTALPDAFMDNTQLQFLNGYVFVAGNEEAPAKIQALLAALEKRLLRTVSIEHTNYLAAASDDAADANAPRTKLHQLVMPTLLGRYVTGQRRIETNIIEQVGVEIAQEAKATIPIVSLLQTGSWLQAHTAMMEGRGHLSIRAVMTHCDSQNPRLVAPEGALTLPSVTGQDMAHSGFVTNNQQIRHGDGPLILTGDRPRRSEVVTTMRW